MLILRDMIEADIEDYVRWFTADTQWILMDAPGESFETTEEEERRAWTEFYDSIKDLPEDVLRWRYEIQFDGVHIGWISSYSDLGYLENTDDIAAIGLDIPAVQHRKNGCGTKALQMYMDYLKKYGHKSFFVQTWSGNAAMLSVARKLGFREFYRKENAVEVHGAQYDAITLRIDY